MEQREGLPLVKLMMLLSSMAPLFILVGIKGIDEKVLSEKFTWLIIICLIVIPLLVVFARQYYSKKSKDIFTVNSENATLNKEYLFTYLFTVLLPLYSVSIDSKKDLASVICAIFFVVFVLWNLNMHFINIFFAFQGYRVYTLPNNNSAILLSSRQFINSNVEKIQAHRLSNSVYIELKNYSYDS
jgi:hypothetical protein